MKLIISGSTGFVGTEVLRQALSHPAIKEVVCLGRRETAIPQNLAPGANPAKLKSIICEDFLNYPESVRGELKGVDACVWLLAVTPARAKLLPWEEVRKICHEYAVTGLKTIAELQQPRPTSRPLRFIYVSGVTGERDQSKKHWIMGDYMKLRGETENFVLNYAKESNGAIESCVAKPGLIFTRTWTQELLHATVSKVGIKFELADEVAATLLEQAVSAGRIEKDTLWHEDLKSIGQKALKEQEKGDDAGEGH